MPDAPAAAPSNVWLWYALLTVATWGLYGVFLHKSGVGMADPANGRYKAFLMVGIAYFITAVLAPLGLMMLNKATWSFPTPGIAWGLTAGIVGAVGAIGVLLAFGAKGSPSVVMSIIFAGAPVVNAIIATWMNPPPDGIGSIRWQFVGGILMAAVGGCLVMLYRPESPAPPAPAAPPTQPIPSASATPPVQGAPAP